MAYVKKEFSFPSVSGLADIHAASYIPEDGKVKAVFQIAHGMAEHFERYEKFISVLCDNGLAVFTNDHVGHGQSVKSDDDLGYFGDAGWNALVEDCRKLMLIAKDAYPSVPYIFFGHSMGSFVARSFIARYGAELAGSIICGTGGSNPALGMGIMLAKLIQAVEGAKHRSKFIDNLAFGTYNKHTENRTQFDWLTTDTATVDAYIADPHCGYLFTVNGLLNLFLILKEVNSKKWYASIRKDLPLFFIAGADDPVGNYGVGPHEVSGKLSDAGVEDVELNLYGGCRHEILNEPAAFEQVCKDVIAFVNRVIA